MHRIILLCLVRRCADLLLTFDIVHTLANGLGDGKLCGSSARQHARVEHDVTHHLHRILAQERAGSREESELQLYAAIIKRSSCARWGPKAEEIRGYL